MVEIQEKPVPELKSTAVPEQAHTTLKNILTLNLTACDITVCLAALPVGETIPQYELLVLHEDVTTAFRDMLATLLKRYRDAYEKRDMQPRHYEITTKLAPYEMEWLDLSMFPAIRQQIEPLATSSEFSIFTEEQDFLDRLRFYVIIVQRPPHAPIYFYRHFSPKQLLERSRYLIIQRLWNNTYEYTRLTDSAFLFDKYIDCISCGNNMFIFKKDGFQQVFHYLEDLEEKADEMLMSIKNRQLIANFDDFAKACKGHYIKMLILKSISTKPDLATFTPEKLRATIEQYGLPIDIDAQGLLIYNPQEPWEILKLLDEHYVISSITGENYEANSKRRHERKRKR